MLHHNGLAEFKVSIYLKFELWILNFVLAVLDDPNTTNAYVKNVLLASFSNLRFLLNT